MIKFYRGSRENFDATKHSEGIYFTNDTAEILTGQEASYGKNADASTTTADIVVAGGPLADDITTNWPEGWVKDGNKVIPSGTSILDILQGLFLKTENGTVTWGNISWSPSLDKPTVALSSDGPVEVGSTVTANVTTKTSVSGNTRSVTCTTTQGYFNTTDGTYLSGNKTVSKSGTTGGTLAVAYSWNDASVSDFTSNSTTLKIKEGTNTFKVALSGITASVDALPETTVYASTNTKQVLSNVSAKLTDTKPATKNLSSDQSDTVTGSYKYYIGEVEGTGMEFTSDLIKGLSTKTGFVSQLTTADVLTNVTVSAGGHTYIIAVPEGYTITQILALNDDAKGAWMTNNGPKATVSYVLPDNTTKTYNIFYSDNVGSADSKFTNLKLGKV